MPASAHPSSSPSGGLRAGAVLACLMLGVACAGPGTGVRRDGGSGSLRRSGSTAAQVLIGASRFSDLQVDRNTGSASGDRITADVSQMPTFGIAGQYKFGGDRLELGMDGGLLFSWASDRETVFGSGGSSVVFVDQDVLVADLFAGVYASSVLGDRVRLYAAGGPSLLWGDSDYRDEQIAERRNAFGIGAYGRAGVEFRLADRSMLGIGARYLTSELDFGGRTGVVDLAGWQGFLTYTVGF